MSSETSFQLKGKRVWVAGHRGMVGSALMRRLAKEDCEILTAVRAEVDLRRQDSTERFLADARPEIVFLAAARVGGILANDTYPAEFLYDNLMIEANVIEFSYRTGVERLVFLGSSCIYPKLAPQPIIEDSLLTGPLEPTNESYAIAKIAGLKMVEAYRRQYGCNFISAMPTNLYGPGDNFDLQSSHVMPALMRKAHVAKRKGDANMTIWGTGTPRREFLHVDDCADAVVFLAKTYGETQHVNVGSGSDITIRGLAEMVALAVGFEGGIVCDTSKPDGTPRKLMGVDKLRGMGWSPRIGLEDGIRSTYGWFLDHHANAAAG